MSKLNREFNVYFQDAQTFYHADHTIDEAEFVDLHKLFYMNCRYNVFSEQKIMSGALVL